MSAGDREFTLSLLDSVSTLKSSKLQVVTASCDPQMLAIQSAEPASNKHSKIILSMYDYFNIYGKSILLINSTCVMQNTCVDKIRSYGGKASFRSMQCAFVFMKKN